MIKIYFQFHIRIYHENISSNGPDIQNNLQKRSTTHYSQHNEKGISFHNYAQKIIRKTWTEKCFSTSRNYHTAISSFYKFYNDKECYLHQISSKMILEYESWLKRKGISKNTASCYLRSLRALYNKAVDEGLTEQKFPFKKAYTGIAKTEKRSIDKADIRKLKALKLSTNTFKCMVRDIFLFCFYACGMPFVDIAFLKKSQIKDGVITYKRHKTGQEIFIKIEPCMEKIINRYSTNDSEYVFPILSSKDKEKAFLQYKNKMCYYNKVLSELEKRCDIDKHLTSYVARHTWASLAFQSDMELQAISSAMGHSNPKTTLIYIKKFGNHQLDEGNRKLLKSI